jgi:hypothetical protein
MTPYEQHRDYRLRYPESMRPTIEVTSPPECASRYAVVDIAERGLRYHVDTKALHVGAVIIPENGTPIEGLMTTHRGADPIPVAGIVVRFQQGEVAVHLTVTPIALAVFLAEQRRVLARARHTL